MSKVVRNVTKRKPKAVAKKGGVADLTKEALNRATRKGSMEAAKRAMETAGSVVTTKDGWIVREFKNGSITKLEPAPKPKALPCR